MITNNLLKIKVSELLYENRIPKNTPSHLNLLAKFTCQILDYSLRMPRIILFHFCCIYSKVISYKDVVKQEFASNAEKCGPEKTSYLDTFHAVVT